MNSQTKTDDQKRFFIHTLGCKVNQYESEAMREILIKAGFKECISKEVADIYIVNTCTVTHHADRESRYLVGMYHRTNPKARIIVTGCFIERDSSDISFLPGVSNIIKNEDKARIAEILTGSASPLSAASYPLNLSVSDFKGHSKAFVKIQDGCENFCSYCKVPLVRGALHSKPVKDIIEEVGRLVSNGFKEIILTGICLGAWGKDLASTAIADGIGIAGPSILDVLKSLDELKGDFRIRLSSIEPRYVTDDLVNYMAQNKRICRHLHIPFQSGDDEVLKKMNRPYTTQDYKRIVNGVRSKIKDVAITTDMLVGFSGEADMNFRNTLSFIKEILPSRTHIFTFSKRLGTPAHDMDGEVKDDIIKKRYHELNAVALGTSYIYRSNFVGKRLDVLVETRRDKQSGLLTGYSDNYIKVLFQGPDSLMKNIVPIRIDDLTLMHTMGTYE